MEGGDKEMRKGKQGVRRRRQGMRGDKAWKWEGDEVEEVKDGEGEWTEI